MKATLVVDRQIATSVPTKNCLEHIENVAEKSGQWKNRVSVNIRRFFLFFCSARRERERGISSERIGLNKDVSANIHYSQ